MNVIRWVRWKLAALFFQVGAVFSLLFGTLLLLYLSWQKRRDEARIMREMAPLLAMRGPFSAQTIQPDSEEKPCED